MHKKIILGIFAALMVAGGFVAYAMVGPASYADEPINTPQAGSLDDGLLQAPNLPSKTNDENGVTVTITPLRVSSEVETWEFDVVLSTHVQELGGYDLTKLVTLVDEDGNAFKPSAWSPDATEGHHIGGILKFDRPTTAPGLIEVRIQGVGGVDERNYSWNVDK